MIIFICAADINLIMEKQNSSGESAVETGTEADDGRDTWLPSRRGILKLTGGGLGAMAAGGTLLGSASALPTLPVPIMPMFMARRPGTGSPYRSPG